MDEIFLRRAAREVEGKQQQRNCEEPIESTKPIRFRVNSYNVTICTRLAAQAILTDGALALPVPAYYNGEDASGQS
ncbi:MAG: hypothetical protein U0930_01595 [Pirellulales bacterium]